jgi:hypothetical protein
MSAFFSVKAQEQAKPADAFIESIGIGDRFDWLNDDGNLGKAQTALSSLKIRYVRMGIAAQSGSSTYITNTKNMASSLGVKLCVLTDISNAWSIQKAWLDTWRGYAGTTAVEGPNEIGNNPTVAGIQQSIWNYAHPLGMEVYAWTLGAQAGYYRTEGISNGGATVDNYCDYLNFHPYHWYTSNYTACKMNGLWQNGDFDNLGFGTNGCINQVRTMAGDQNKPFVSTEFGWCINGLEEGVGINYAKKYVVRNCFENFNAGMHRGFIFSLTDYAGAGADYALASSANGSLNATGQTVANTISILQEPGKNTITTTSLNYSLTGISSTGGHPALSFPAGVDDHNVLNDEIHHTLLQKSNGVYYLVLWCDYDSHNGEDGWAQNAALNLPSGASRVKAYLPMNGTGFVKDYGAVAAGGAISLNTTNGTAIPDHPLILEITPGGGGVNGSLTGSVAFNTTAVNLSTVGTNDWKHFDDNDHKATGSMINSISNYSVIGGTAGSYNNDLRNMSWTGGTPAASSTNNKNGWYKAGIGNGFSFTAVAGNGTNTLKVYAGGWNSGGTLTAHLSNSAAADYVNTKANTTGQWDAVYTINYNAAQPGQTLTITWKQASGTGNVTIQGAALVGTASLAAPAKLPALNDETANSAAAVAVYPNPGNNYTIVNFGKMLNNEQVQVQVIDLSGKTLYQSGNISNKNTLQLNTGKYAKGTYIIKITKGTETINKKLIIQ